LDPQTDPGNVIDSLDESQLEELVFVETTADGGAIVGNRIIEDYGIVADMVSYVLFSRFSADGSLRWQRGYGGYFLASYDDVHAFETQSGDIIVAGTLSYFANQADRNDLWMLRLDRDGKSRWDKLYATEGEDPEGQDAVVVVQELSNGDLIFAGQTSGAGTGDQDLWALRTNAQGEIPNCGLVLDGSAGSFGNSPKWKRLPSSRVNKGTTTTAKRRPFRFARPPLNVISSLARIPGICSRTCCCWGAPQRKPSQERLKRLWIPNRRPDSAVEESADLAFRGIRGGTLGERAATWRHEKWGRSGDRAPTEDPGWNTRE
jgi:hypothetical protein